MATTTAPSPFDELQRLLDDLPEGVRARTACEVSAAGRVWPVPVFTLGAADPSLPALGVFGGVHGLERIGFEVALAFLQTLLGRLAWDDSLHQLLQGLRVVVMPLVNPGGLLRGTRANPQGVDLMRNAPVECAAGAPWLLGGQRIGPGLPWYRGPAGAPMEPEAQALCEAVEHELLGRPFAMALDCHSGFGLTDRLWFPHAHTTVPVEHLPEYHALSRLLDAALLHHRYVFEPQSRQYLAHGDLWDHLYLRARQAQAANVFLPLTLEMGSWLWVKKNPRQVFSRHGIFNPLIEHRQQRVLRRHLQLLDFALRAAHSHRRWRPGGDVREASRVKALSHWYGTVAAA
ncbi:MAG: zinc carboxypeptidase [Rhizobacter sp.]|nr:zinc carboxypeptidase [Rhizobacter sp.]